VLDLGAGTGRITLPLLQAGASVTACDASQQMLDVLRQKTDSSKLQLFVADAHQLQFADKSFDCAMTFRMLLHVIDWKKALSELCRVSRDWLVFDFPPKHGFLLLAPLRHWLTRTSQSYQTFNVNEVKSELKKNGFEVVTTDPGFFLPLAIYRVLNRPSLMRGSEKVFSAVGLTRLAGSPMTIFARRVK
jgi:SAM-dependent methyltransferase